MNCPFHGRRFDTEAYPVALVDAGHPRACALWWQPEIAMRCRRREPDWRTCPRTAPELEEFQEAA